jgi:two-component system phosphate regulon sensor histidine kinase PhoR
MAKRLLPFFFSPHLLVVLIVLVALAFYGIHVFRVAYYEKMVVWLETQANLVREQIPEPLEKADFVRLDALCKKLGRSGPARITVILPSGKVVADSAEDPAVMDNHADRPEFIAAMKTGRGRSERYSFSVKKAMMYAAVALKDGNRTEAVVRTSLPAKTFEADLRGVETEIVLFALALAIFAAALNSVLLWRRGRLVEQISATTRKFEEGELGSKIWIPDSADLAPLARALNEMARKLQQKIRVVTEQRNQLETVFSSMAEGVIAIDAQGHIMSLNTAAANLLGVDPGTVRGRSIQEIVRNVALQQFVEKTLEGKQTMEREIFFHTNGGRFLYLRGTCFPDSRGIPSGAVVVLADLTQIRKLEQVRREFVANVSHELKTPVTSIKGFVETLQDGAVERPEEAKRFLTIIAKQAERLNAIIEDILSLSRIEEDNERGRFVLKQGKLKPVLKAAAELYEAQASKKRIGIELSCDDAIEARIHAPILEHAVMNLLDNAVKFTPEGGTIRVSGGVGDDGIRISIQDNGCGIEEPHLPRIFERFYVVDKARSRKLGGTGLGLALVKHIAQAHGGCVTAESTVGKGSLFTIHLPLP